jgi:MFS family permease
MDEKIDKLISLAGNKHKYQIFCLILIFLLWVNCNFMACVLPLLERKPIIDYFDKKEQKNYTDSLSYDLCDKLKNEEIIEWNRKVFNYSWISYYEIECNKEKTGLISSFTFVGNMFGALFFAPMTKIVSHKNNVIVSTFGFSLSIFLLIIIKNFYILLGLLVGVGTFGNFLCYSSLVLIEESVSHDRRSLYGNIVNIGYPFCGITYVVLFYFFENWKIVFYILIAFIFFICGLIWIFIYNSPRGAIEKRNKKEILKILNGIAKFNNKSDYFENIESEEYQNIINEICGETNENENDEKLIPNTSNLNSNLSKDLLNNENENNNNKNSKMQNITAISLIKYPSIRYKFLILCYSWFTACGIYNGISVASKNLEGNFYLIQIGLFIAESIAYFISGILMEIKILGRKRTIWGGMFITIACLLILALISVPDLVYFFLDLLSRFCISAVHTIFYTYSLEVYPTPVRTIGFGINATFGQIGGIVFPMLVELFPEYLCFIGYSCLITFAVFLLFFLKETVGLPMKETIDELCKSVDFIEGEVTQEKLVEEEN